MNQVRAKNFLEVTSNVAVVVAALVVVVSFAQSHLLPTRRVVLQGGLQKGALFPRIAGVDFSQSQKTLLVALDPNCEYCSDSLPFFKSLAEKLRGRSNDTRIVTVFQSSEESARRYVQQSQLNVDTVFGVDFKMLNLSAVPAIILIGDNGTVLDFWIGKPSTDTEEQIIHDITVGT